MISVGKGGLRWGSFSCILYVLESLGIVLNKSYEHRHFIVPTSDLCHLWQRDQEIDFKWYFSMLKAFDVKRVMLDRVPQSSDFSEKLQEQLQNYGLTTEHVLTLEEWNQWHNKRESLEKGHHFCFLIYNSVTPDFLHEILGLQEFIGQMKFVIIARKDWNFRNTFRSIPHFMRDYLYVDFPLSTYAHDPFYETAEIQEILSQMSRDFRKDFTTPYCPHLRFVNTGLQCNIASISMPRKLSKATPKLSLVTRTPEQVEKLKDLSIIKQYGNEIEILIARVAGEKTQVIPKLKNVLTTRYWVHPIDSTKEISTPHLYNFSASQADGELLFFIDDLSEQDLDAGLKKLLESSISPEDLKVSQLPGVFEKTQFLEKGGLDPAYTDIDMAWFDLNYRVRVNPTQKQKIDINQSEGISLNKKINFELFTHKFVDSIDDFSEQIEKNQERSLRQKEIEKKNTIPEYRWQWAKDMYFTLYRSSPKVAMEGNFSFIYRFFYRIYRFTYHHYRMNAWKLNPMAYKFFWKLRYLPHKFKGWLKQAQGWMIRAKWVLFELSFPFRKVYYFSHYQYEKRILGLHREAKMAKEKH